MFDPIANAVESLVTLVIWTAVLGSITILGLAGWVIYLLST